MINLTVPNEWQYQDESLGGILFPWYVKPFLDELATWDLKDKTVFEYGMGASSLWWANKAGKVFGVDNNLEWFSEVVAALKGKGNYEHIEDREDYCNAVSEWSELFDIIIIDGAYRDECVIPALNSLKEGGILVVDNWMQPSVEIASEENQELLLSMAHRVFKQPGHPDWQTAIFYNT